MYKILDRFHNEQEIIGSFLTNLNSLSNRLIYTTNRILSLNGLKLKRSGIDAIFEYEQLIQLCVRKNR